MFKKTVIAITLIALSASPVGAASDDIGKKFEDSEAYSHYEAGNNYLTEAQCEKAIAEYNKAAELFPDYYVLYTKLGYAHYYLGRFDEALEYLRKSLTLNAACAQTIIGFGNVYMALKQEDEAAIYFEKAISMDSDNTAPYMPLALIYSHKKRFNDAIPLLKKVVGKYPRYDLAYFTLAQDYELLNDVDSAIENYKKIINLTPGYVQAYLGLARCYAAKKRYNIAYNCVQLVRRLRPDAKEETEAIGISLRQTIRSDKKERERKKAPEGEEDPAVK